MTTRRSLLLAGALLLAGCKRQATETETAKEEVAVLASAFTMTDANAETQMTHGFHAVENGRWRWVASKFGVTLALPAGAERGAQLELKFALPASVFDRLGPVTLKATADGKPLAPETFSAAGDYTYTKELAAGTVGPGAVAIEFSTDKAIPPGEKDIRELALIVTQVGLTAK